MSNFKEGENLVLLESIPLLPRHRRRATFTFNPTLDGTEAQTQYSYIWLPPITLPKFKPINRQIDRIVDDIQSEIYKKHGFTYLIDAESIPDELYKQIDQETDATVAQSDHLRSILEEIADYYSAINDINPVNGLELVNVERQDRKKYNTDGYYNEDEQIISINVGQVLCESPRYRNPWVATTTHEWLHHWFNVRANQYLFDKSPHIDEDHTEQFLKLEKVLSIESPKQAR